MIRLLFLDDHPVVAAGLAARYAAASGFEVVATVATFAEAFAVVAQRTTDIAVVDVQLEKLITPRHVAALAEHCRVVLFSARAGDPVVHPLLAAGAVAAVDKAAPLAELDIVLRNVFAGRAMAAAPSRPPATSARELLTTREHAVFCALARCETPKEVAASLGIAASTVYCHIERIRQKLGVQTLQEIVARAYAEHS